MAPRTEATWRALSDPERRPVPREGLSREVQQAEPAEQFELEPTEFLTCLRKARRGAAPGPSGMTSATSSHCMRVKQIPSSSHGLAVTRVPHVILEAIRLGRLTALSKPDGGVRGIVVGDMLRRLVARTTARYPRKQGASVSLASSRHCQIAILKPPSCPSMGLERSI